MSDQEGGLKGRSRGSRKVRWRKPLRCRLWSCYSIKYEARTSKWWETPGHEDSDVWRLCSGPYFMLIAFRDNAYNTKY